MTLEIRNIQGPVHGGPAREDGGYKLQALNIISEVSASLADEDDVEELLGRFLGTMIRLADARPARCAW